MSNNATPTQVSQTEAIATPSRAISKRAVKPALPDPIDAQDVLERISEIGIHWWSLIDSVLEMHQFSRSNESPPLPAWALERLKDQGRHSASHDEFSKQGRLLEEWLHLAAGNGSQQRFEVWTSRNSRLAFRHESWEEAAAILDRLKPQHPDAFIARLHVLTALGGRDDDPALLDTLIGKTWHIGTFYTDNEDSFTVQDETGRQVTVRASILRQHRAFDRLPPRCKESLDLSIAEHLRKKGGQE